MTSHPLALQREWTDQNSVCFFLSFAGCLPHGCFCSIYCLLLTMFSFVLLSTLVFSATSDGWADHTPPCSQQSTERGCAPSTPLCLFSHVAMHTDFQLPVPLCERGEMAMLGNSHPPGGTLTQESLSLTGEL